MFVDILEDIGFQESRQGTELVGILLGIIDQGSNLDKVCLDIQVDILSLDNRLDTVS